MPHRIYNRRPAGQFTRPTLESALGLSAPICPKCGGFNPYRLGEAKPVVCGQCGASMEENTEENHEH